MLKIATIKSWISLLARSQGFYGRLQNTLNEEGKWNDLKSILNKNKITNVIDFVMFIEG